MEDIFKEYKGGIGTKNLVRYNRLFGKVYCDNVTVIWIMFFSIFISAAIFIYFLRFLFK